MDLIQGFLAFLKGRQLTTKGYFISSGSTATVLAFDYKGIVDLNQIHDVTKTLFIIAFVFSSVGLIGNISTFLLKNRSKTKSINRHKLFHLSSEMSTLLYKVKSEESLRRQSMLSRPKNRDLLLELNAFYCELRKHDFETPNVDATAKYLDVAANLEFLERVNPHFSRYNFDEARRVSKQVINSWSG